MSMDVRKVKEVRNRIRQAVWGKLMETGVARSPLPVYGRIPNFAGAEKAAYRLTRSREFIYARVVKVCPDSPQRTVRLEVLKQGKILIMPTPRIREGFLLLDPRRVPASAYGYASTIRGAFRYGVKVKPWDLPDVDLIVMGSVAVDLRGTRLGKGEGYSELEYAILREFNKVGEDTPIFTTVHDLQVLSDIIPRLPWDVTVDVIFTPSRTIKCSGPKQRTRGILWDYLSEDNVKEIPLLKEVAERKGVRIAWRTTN